MLCINCGCSVESSQHHAADRRNLIIYNLPSSHPVFPQDMNSECHLCWIKHRRYSNTDENKSNHSQNPDQLELYGGVVKTETDTKSTVDVDETESIVVKEELPAVCERLDDIIETKKEYESDEDLKPVNIYDNYLDIIEVQPLRQSASDSQDYLPLLGVKTEMEEELDISNMEKKAMKTYKRDSATDYIENYVDSASDSAVSSMGSERVPSLSDEEWCDGSDSAQEFHISKFRPYDNSFGRERAAPHQPQKKHHMFGKRCFQCQIPSPVPRRFVYATLKRVRHDHTYSDQRPAAVRDKRVRRLTDGSMSDGGSSATSRQHLSRDEKRAKALVSAGIGLEVQDIIDLSMDEFHERLSKLELSEAQLSLIRDIRRRGKNKVAAHNCRKRKLDQITSLADEVRSVRDRKVRTQWEHSSLIAERQRVKERFAALYRHVFQITQ